MKASDLLIEDTPPGSLEAMGLGYDDLERINPGLIMLSITPFGQTGPHSGWKAYNLNTIHAGGEGWLMPPGLAQRMFPGREPVKTGAYVGEYYCGVTAASAAIIGVFGRAASGRGQHIDMSKQEAHATLARIAIGMWAQSGFVETRGNPRHSLRRLRPLQGRPRRGPLSHRRQPLARVHEDARRPRMGAGPQVRHPGGAL